MSSDPAPPSVAISQRASETPNVWDDVRFQKLWLATQRREWRSLAVLGASRSIDTLRIAELLAKLAWRYRGKPSCVFDLRDLSLRLVEYQEREVRVQAAAGVCVIIALRPSFENPTSIPIARSADAVVMCIDLGVADVQSTEQTMDEIGRDRVVGAIVLRQRRAKSRTNG